MPFSKGHSRYCPIYLVCNGFSFHLRLHRVFVQVSAHVAMPRTYVVIISEGFLYVLWEYNLLRRVSCSSARLLLCPMKCVRLRMISSKSVFPYVTSRVFVKYLVRILCILQVEYCHHYQVRVGRFTSRYLDAKGVTYSAVWQFQPFCCKVYCSRLLQVDMIKSHPTSGNSPSLAFLNGYGHIC